MGERRIRGLSANGLEVSLGVLCSILYPSSFVLLVLRSCSINLQKLALDFILARRYMRIFLGGFFFNPAFENRVANQ
jgi:hypothetical protein